MVLVNDKTSFLVQFQGFVILVNDKSWKDAHHLDLDGFFLANIYQLEPIHLGL